MDGKMLVRLGAIVFVAFVITVTAIEWSRKEDARSTSTLPVLVLPHEADPLRESQLRCQLLGQKAANDAECLRVWAEMRNRFLGKTSSPAPPASSEGR